MDLNRMSEMTLKSKKYTRPLNVAWWERHYYSTLFRQATKVILKTLDSYAHGRAHLPRGPSYVRTVYKYIWSLDDPLGESSHRWR